MNNVLWRIVLVLFSGAVNAGRQCVESDYGHWRASHQRKDIVCSHLQSDSCRMWEVTSQCRCVLSLLPLLSFDLSVWLSWLLLFHIPYYGLKWLWECFACWQRNFPKGLAIRVFLPPSLLFFPPWFASVNLFLVYSWPCWLHISLPDA